MVKIYLYFFLQRQARYLFCAQALVPRNYHSLFTLVLLSVYMFIFNKSSLLFHFLLEEKDMKYNNKDFFF